MNRRIILLVVAFALGSMTASAEKKIVRQNGAQILVNGDGNGKWLNCAKNAVAYDERLDKLQDTLDVCPPVPAKTTPVIQPDWIVRPDGHVLNPDGISKGAVDRISKGAKEIKAGSGEKGGAK